MSKTILITGISSGLGLNLLEKLLGSGDFVYGISRSSNSKLDDLKDKYSEKFKHIQMDLGSVSDIETSKDFSFFKEVKLDGLVNNAACGSDDLLTHISVEDLENLFKVNVYAPIILTKMAIKNMLLFDTRGSLVHVSSLSGHTGFKGLSAYASTKGALEAFSLNVAREWGSKGIRSNCVAPGFMKTNMTNNIDEESLERIKKRASLKELTDIGSVIEVIELLLSNRSRSVTGQTYNVDSGAL